MSEDQTYNMYSNKGNIQLLIFVDLAPGLPEKLNIYQRQKDSAKPHCMGSISAPDIVCLLC